MQTILTIIVYSIAAALIVLGGYRAVRCKWLQKVCTQAVPGEVIEIEKKRSLLMWPNTQREYPIFLYTADGQEQVGISEYPAQHRGQLSKGAKWTVCYDPGKPTRFFATGWDEGNFMMGLSQLTMGLIFFVLTLVL